MAMRKTFCIAAVLSVALVAAAQSHAPLVPVMGMSAGCPSDWAHREGGAASFGCRDVEHGSFCNGHYRPVAGASQADEVTAIRAGIVARGFVILRERDEQGMHALVYDDAAGHRVMQFDRRDPGRVVEVVCGSAPEAFDALVPTFVSIAGTAR
jgi:hypothetical protein